MLLICISMRYIVSTRLVVEILDIWCYMFFLVFLELFILSKYFRLFQNNIEKTWFVCLHVHKFIKDLLKSILITCRKHLLSILLFPLGDYFFQLCCALVNTRTKTIYSLSYHENAFIFCNISTTTWCAKWTVLKTSHNIPLWLILVNVNVSFALTGSLTA